MPELCGGCAYFRCEESPFLGLDVHKCALDDKVIPPDDDIERERPGWCPLEKNQEE